MTSLLCKEWVIFFTLMYRYFVFRESMTLRTSVYQNIKCGFWGSIVAPQKATRGHTNLEGWGPVLPFTATLSLLTEKEAGSHFARQPFHKEAMPWLWNRHFWKQECGKKDNAACLIWVMCYATLWCIREDNLVSRIYAFSKCSHYQLLLVLR